MDHSQFAPTSPLIAPELEAQLKPLLERLTQEVTLVCLAGTDGKSREMGAFLRHIASLSPRLTLRFVRPGEEPETDAQLDAGLLPATGIYTPLGFSRMVFHGIPGGREINAFVSALLTAGGAAKPLDKYTLKDIGRIRQPTRLQVCVSLGCHHCAALVANAHRIAWENPQVIAHMIDANLYPELVAAQNIQRVPLTLVNGSRQIPGGKTMAELTTLLARG